MASMPSPFNTLVEVASPDSMVGSTQPVFRYRSTRPSR